LKHFKQFAYVIYAFFAHSTYDEFIMGGGLSVRPHISLQKLLDSFLY